MSQQERATPKKSADAAAISMQNVEAAEKEATSFSGQEAENLARTASNYNKAFGEVAGLYAGNMHACVECNSKMSGVMRDISAEIMENSANAFSELSNLSKDMLSAKSPADLAALQTRLSQLILDSYFNEASKLSAMLFDGYGKALEPLRKRGLLSQEQLQKILTAWRPSEISARNSG